VSRYLSGPDSYFDVPQSASALQTFLLAMVLYPDVQARARADIDKIVRHDQMPCLDDRASLPYIDAILREVLRWYPVAPLGWSAVVYLLFACLITCAGAPHMASNDDVYDGYFIPKGSKSYESRLLLAHL
jgi:hypothetical protein